MSWQKSGKSEKPEKLEKPAKAEKLQSTSTGLVISSANLRPEQKLFNELLAKVAKRQQNLVTLQALLDAHRTRCAEKLEPLHQQMQQLMKKMIVALDQRLQQGGGKGLSKSLRATLVEIVLDTVGELQGTPEADSEVEQIFRRYAPNAVLAQMDGKNAQAEPEFAADEAPQKPSLDAEEAPEWDDFEEVLRQAIERDALRQSRRKKTPKQQQAEEEQLDAKQALRSIYRKLASALHPDREPDEQERLRKTALMVEANAAYANNDLLALLQLQLKSEQIDSNAIAGMAEEKIRPYNRMLKTQAEGLHVQHDRLALMIRETFDLDYGPITARVLDLALRDRAEVLNQIILQMTEDVQSVQDDQGLKLWVKQQKAMAQRNRQDEIDELDGLMEVLMRQSR